MTDNQRAPEVKQLRLVVEAEDFEEAVVFYRDVLGLREEFSVDSESGAVVIALQAGRATLEIVNPAQRRLIDEFEVGREVSRKHRGDQSVTNWGFVLFGAFNNQAAQENLIDDNG